MSKKNKPGRHEAPADNQPKRGLFGGLGAKKQEAAAPPVEQDTAPVVTAKPSESMSTVLSESVPAASLDLIRANDAFCYPNGARDGETCYVVVGLDVKDIGGLNRHMKGDQDKGQFIECINSGRIETHVSAEGLEEGKLYIIPSPKTLANLDEYDFLSNPSRFNSFIPTLVHVDANGNMEFEEYPESRVNFVWLADISKKRVSLTDAIRGVMEAAGGAKSGGSDDDAAMAVESDASDFGVQDEDNMGYGYGDDGGNGADDGVLGDMFGIGSQGSAQASESSPDDDSSIDGSLDQAMPSDGPDGGGSDTEPAAPAASAKEAPLPDYHGPVYGQEQGGNKPEDTDWFEDQPEDDMGITCRTCGHVIYDVTKPCPVCGGMLHMQAAFDAPAEEEDDGVIEEDNVTDAEISEACERLFHAGGLDLEISAQPFDARFGSSNPFVPITEDRSDGWLDRYVTQMVKNANSELRNAHKQNLYKARQRYLALMTDSCEEIAVKVDSDNPSTPYYEMKKKLSREAADKRASIESEVDKRRTDMQAKWAEELEQIMSSASQAARRTYLDKHSAEHEQKLRDVETLLQDDIEIAYQRDMADLNEKRKEEADRLMDLHISAALHVIGEDYQAMLDEEEQLRKQFLDQIQAYIDEHRREEVARNDVAAEKLRQHDAAEAVTAEYERRIRGLSADHAATCDKYVQELAAVRSHEEGLKREYNERYKAFSEREQESTAKYDALLDRFTALDGAKSREYEARMTALKNDKDAAEEHLAHVDRVHNKYNKVAMVVWIAIAVATFAIGVLVGGMFLGKYIGGSGNVVSGNGGGNYTITLTPGGQTSGDSSDTGSAGTGDTGIISGEQADEGGGESGEDASAGANGETVPAGEDTANGSVSDPGAPESGQQP